MGNNIKLILLDLDGTLLDNKSKVPADLKEVIELLKEKDVTVGIASGRNFSLIKNDFPDTYNKMAIISSNGCSARLNDSLIFSVSLSHKDALNILNKWEEIKEFASMQIMNDDLFIAERNDPVMAYFGAVEGEGIKLIDNIYEGIDSAKLLSVCAHDMKTDYSSHFNELKDEIEIVESGYGCTDFMPKNISKGSGAIELCKSLNISIDQVMAIGDATNDLDLLKTVGVPVAMKNGNDNIKKISKYITSKTNDENGCLEFIRSYFKL